MIKYSPFFFFCSILFFQSCYKPEPQRDFEHKAIFFTIPKGWKDIEMDTSKSDQFYYSFEKQGWDESGLVSVEAFQGYYDLPGSLDTTREEFKKVQFMQWTDLYFSPTATDEFAGTRSYYSKFTGKLLGTAFQGNLRTFYLEACDCMIILYNFAANEDVSDYADDLQLFEKSFKCLKISPEQDSTSN